MSASAYPRIEVNGVFSSCEAFATKSLRTASSLLISVMSSSVVTAPPWSKSPRRHEEVPPGQLDLLGRPVPFERPLEGFPERRMPHHRTDRGVRRHLGQVQKRACGAVGTQEAPVLGQRHDPLGHAVDEHLHLVALLAELREPGAQLVAEPVERDRHVAELRHATLGRAAREVALREPAGPVGQRDQGTCEHLAQQVRGHQRDHHGQHSGDGHGPLNPVDGPFDLDARRAHAEDHRDAIEGAERRTVQQGIPHGRAGPLREAHPLATLHDAAHLRPRQVVLDIRDPGAADVRLPEHGPAVSMIVTR
jgi:hypothetical protein